MQSVQKTVQAAAKTHSTGGIKGNVQQKALSAHTATNLTTGWQCVVKHQ